MIDSRDKPRGSTINLKGIDDRLKGSSRSRGTVDSHTQGRNRKTYPGIPIYEELLNRMTKRFENPRHSVQRPATQRGSERLGKDIRIETRKLEPHIPPRRGKTRSPSLACEDLADSSEFPSPTLHRSTARQDHAKPQTASSASSSSSERAPKKKRGEKRASWLSSEPQVKHPWPKTDQKTQLHYSQADG